MPVAKMYQALFHRLASEGIRTVDDVRKVPPDYNRGVGFSFLSARAYPWVRDVFRIVDRHYDDLLDGYRARVARPLIVDRAPGGLVASEAWGPTDAIFRMRTRYGCILPRQCLFSCNQFIATGEQGQPLEGSECIPKDFLPMLFALRPLLESGLATLLPSRMNYQHPELLLSSGLGLHPLVQQDGSIVVGNAGHGGRALARAAASANAGPDAMQWFFIKMPWLRRARTEDLVEIALEHPQEFRRYTQSLGNALAGTASPDATMRALADDLHASTLELDILYRNKQRELRRKGFDVTLGAFMTVGAVFVPGAQLFAPLAGGKTLWDCIRFLQDRRELRSSLGNEKAWVLWSLKQGKA